MKRRLPVTVILVGLLVLAGTGIWWLCDNVARSVANHLLDGSALQIIEVIDIQPTLTATTIGELAAELTGSGRIQRFQDIEVTYSASGLRSGRVQGIRVGRADVDLAAGAAASESATEPPRLTEVSEMIRQAPWGPCTSVSCASITCPSLTGRWR